MKLKDWLTAIMAEKGVSAYGLAKLAGTSPSCVYRLLNGSRLPKHQTLLQISKATGKALPIIELEGSKK